MTRTPVLLALAAAFALGGAWMLARPDAADGGLGQAGGQSLLPGAAQAQDAQVSGGEAADGAADDGAAVTIPDMALGAQDAPVTVIEYASFTCPHCAAFHADQFPRLKAEYVDTGLVRFVYREVYFDRFGLWASMIARCGDAAAPEAGSGRFFGIADLLYEGQREWIGEGEPAAIADNLRRIGRTAGLDDAALDACLRDEAQAEALVAWFQANAEADEVSATPTLVIDGATHSNMGYDELKAILDEALAG